MTDVFSKSKRSEIMRAIGQKNTKPEITVRRVLHRMGFRFRLHRADLPGTPDIILPRHRKVIFVNGCFWHSHEGCTRAILPQTNRYFWERKIQQNKLRDRKKMEELEKSGWKPIVIWQCQTKNLSQLQEILNVFLKEG
jgi:DNA mismatch endonuclease (patch repair protein)